MRKTVQRIAARLDGACNPQSYRISVERAEKAIVAIGACLFVCLLLHVDISVLTSSAYASTWPVGSSREGVCLAFGEAYTFDSSTYTHRGIDIPVDAGNKVRAPLGGVVSFVGRVPSGDSIKRGAGHGETMTAVSIELEDGKTVTLMPFGEVVAKKGQRVAEGDEVGTLAATGDRSSKVPHLHMGLKEGGRYCDPLSLFGAAATQESQAAASETASVPDKDVMQMQGLPPSAVGAASEVAPKQARNPLPVEEGEPSFGTISSKTANAGSIGAVEDEKAGTLSLLDVLGTACSTQLNDLFAGYGELGEKAHLPAQLLLLASALLGVLVVAAATGSIIVLIRRNVAHEKVRENSSLHAKRGGASIYGLFPAPGTSFITRGRLAQRR